MSEEGLIVHIEPGRPEKYYARLRQRVVDWLADHRGDNVADVLLLAPDLFVLLWRLMLDSRVAAKDRAILTGALLYFLSPLDLVPDLIVPAGILDDVVAAIIALRGILNNTDPAIVREHWEGGEDILQVIQRVLDRADDLVGGGALRRLRRALARRTPAE